MLHVNHQAVAATPTEPVDCPRSPLRPSLSLPSSPLWVGPTAGITRRELNCDSRKSCGSEPRYSRSGAYRCSAASAEEFFLCSSIINDDCYSKPHETPALFVEFRVNSWT